MADVQLENGYTRIANKILDALAKYQLNGTQRRIIDVIWRFTYGFNKKEHDFSISFLLNALGLKRTQYKQVCRELKFLLDMKIIIEVLQPTRNNSRRLSFNKNYDLWTNKTTGLNRLEDKKDQRVSTKKSIQPLDELDHQLKKGLNKTLNKNMCVSDITPAENPPSGGGAQETGKGEYTEEFKQFWEHYPRGIRKIAAFKCWNIKLSQKVSAEDMTNAAINYSKQCETAKTETQYILHPATFLGPSAPYKDYVKGVPEDIKPKQNYEKPVPKYKQFEQHQYDDDYLDKLIDNIAADKPDKGGVP